MEDPCKEVVNNLINLKLLDPKLWRNSHLSLKDLILQLLIKVINRSRKRQRISSRSKRSLQDNLTLIAIDTKLVKMWTTSHENQGKIRDQNSNTNKVAKRVSNNMANQCLQHFSRYHQSQDSQVLLKRITFWANIMTSPKRTNTKPVNNSSLKSTRATIPNNKKASPSIKTEQVNH